MRSSNGDCEKTTQHFAIMSASDFFYLSMLRLAEKRAKRFRNMLLVISPAGIDFVTRNFSYRVLVSYSQAAQFDPENMLATS